MVIAKVLIARREGGALNEEVVMNDEIKEDLSTFKFWVSCFSGVGSLHDVVKVGMEEELNIFGAMRMFRGVRSVTLYVKLYVKVTCLRGWGCQRRKKTRILGHEVF